MNCPRISEQKRYRLERIYRGETVKCEYCLHEDNILVPHTLKDLRPTTEYDCSNCKKALLTADEEDLLAFEMYLNAQEEARELEEIEHRIDNVLSDDEVESLRRDLKEIRQRITGESVDPSDYKEEERITKGRQEDEEG